jgi:hypothetical protein
MPKFLEEKLAKEYGAKNKHAIYGTMNKIGAMHGNKITAKGEAMERKHEQHIDRGHSSVRNRGSHAEKLRHS